MAGEIFIADKLTLDQVKTNTDTIKKDTTYIKNQFPISGGTNWSLYEPYIREVWSTVTNSTPEKTLLKINGSGYIASLLAIQGNTSCGSADIQIFIDDVPIVRSFMGFDNVANTTPGGISTEDFVYSNIKSKIYEYPSNKTDNRGYIPLAQPLFFEKSLEVKFIKDNNGDPSLKVGCRFIGGLKA